MLKTFCLEQVSIDFIAPNQILRYVYICHHSWWWRGAIICCAGCTQNSGTTGCIDSSGTAVCTAGSTVLSQDNMTMDPKWT